MHAIREYLLSIVAVCMIAVLANQLIRDEKLKIILRILSGLLILIVVLKPLHLLNTEQLLEKAGELLQNEELVHSYEEEYHTKLNEQIRSTTEDYIESRAREIGAEIEAVVTLSQEEYPVPVSATIVGKLTFEQMEQLSSFMKDSLGIPTHAQQWRNNG